MSKFKVGDRVKRANGGAFSNGEYVLTVKPACTRIPNLVWFEETNTKLHEELVVLVNPYPNAPHKHAELIKAWADGADIQSRSSSIWITHERPQWVETTEYRIKPSKSDKELQIEKLEQQARDLADEISKLKD